MCLNVFLEPALCATLGQTVWWYTGATRCLCLYLCVCERVCKCVWSAGLITALRAMCGRLSSHVLRPSAPLSIFVGALACGGPTRVTGKQQSASCEQGLFRKNSSTFSFAQWPVFCIKGTHSLARSKIDPPRSSCTLVFTMKMFVLAKDIVYVSNFKFQMKWVIKGVTACFRRADCSESICIPEAWRGISNRAEVWFTGVLEYEVRQGKQIFSLVIICLF